MEHIGMQIVAYGIFGSLMLSMIIFWPLLIAMGVKRLYDYVNDRRYEQKQRGTESARSRSFAPPSAS